jgi:U3 small nucleolar RNA-associated protein 10
VQQRTASEAQINLFGALMIELLQKVSKVSHNFLVRLLPYYLQGMKLTSHPQMMMACYMIIAQLAAKARLSRKLIISIVNTSVKYGLTPGTCQAAVQLLAHLYQCQELDTIPVQALHQLLDYRCV